MSKSKGRIDLEMLVSTSLLPRRRLAGGPSANHGREAKHSEERFGDLVVHVGSPSSSVVGEEVLHWEHPYTFGAEPGAELLS